MAGFATTCLIVLYQPFNTFFFGIDMVLDFKPMLLFALYFYLLKMSDFIANYKWAMGLFWEARKPAVCESILNVLLNYILGKFFGVIGILSATLISIFFCDFIWASTIPFRYYFKFSWIKKYFFRHILYGVVTSVLAFVIYILCSFISLSPILEITIKLLICLVVYNSLYILIYKKTSMFKESVPWILKVFGLKRSC